MKLYDNLRSMVLYNEKSFLPPMGNPMGYGNALFLLSPSREMCYSHLNDDYIQYKKYHYNHIMINLIYKDKIGFKKYLKNNTSVFKKEFEDYEKSMKHPLTLVHNSNKAMILKKNRNLIVNMGEWLRLYFQYKKTNMSIEDNCKTFFNFLESKIVDSDCDNYNKVLYLNIEEWLSGDNKLSLERKALNNPIALLMVALFKVEESLIHLRKYDLILTSPKFGKLLKLKGTDLSRKNYTRIKSLILKLIHTSLIDHESISEEVVESKPTILTDEKTAKFEAAKKELLASVTSKLVGDGADEENDEEINEAKDIASKYIDSHPELVEDIIDSDDDTDFFDKILDEEDSSEIDKSKNKSRRSKAEAIDEVVNNTKNKMYIRQYTPVYTNKQQKEIAKLSEEQFKKFGEIVDETQATVESLKSKIIEETDLTKVLSTKNVNVTNTKFRNFDKNYTEKKLQKDIDNMVLQLSNASRKVFVVDKKVEDTSNPGTISKMYTYTLSDVDGKTHTVKFEVPTIIDNNYVFIGGNKKIIQHMLMLYPIVKTAKDTVQLVTNYNKMFIRRNGSTDLSTNALLKFLMKNPEKFDVSFGNGVVGNDSGYVTTMEYHNIANRITRFTVGTNKFILDSSILDDELKKKNISANGYDRKNLDILLGYTKDGKIISIKKEESFVDKILSMMNEDDVKLVYKAIRNGNGGKLLMYTETTLLNNPCPLILLLCYFEGFSTVMKKANIEYEILSKENVKKSSLDMYNYGIITLRDGYIKWKRSPEATLLINGFNKLDLGLFSIADLDSKDTYTNLLTTVYKYANNALNVDQYYDFMIDPITKEVLIDKKLPTDLVTLCLLANKMLTNYDYSRESNLADMRVRSNEVIASHIYKAITNGYGEYRKTLHRRKPKKIEVAPTCVITGLSTGATLLTEASSLNPILEVSKIHEVSYKGEEGMNMEHAYNLKVRAYNESMLGILGITTSNDAGVGIKRQLALEPKITSTRGYMDTTKIENVEELTSANLLAPSEMLLPLGVQHDDPARTAMAYKQSMYTVLVKDSDPVLVGNGAEKALPYHISNEFSVVAEDDGQVVDLAEDFLVVKYKNGKYRSIDLTTQIKKNSASGFFIENKLTTDLKKGDKFIANQVIAWDDKAFRREENGTEVAMRLGPLVNIAVIPEWDIYEDSIPLSKRASDKLETTMVSEVSVVLSKEAKIFDMKKIGDKVNAGEGLISFNNFQDDPLIMQAFKDLSDDLRENLIETSASVKRSHYSGEIVNVEIDSTLPLEDLSESLQKIVGGYWNKQKKRNKVLKKYMNDGDQEFYMSGNVITHATEPVKADHRDKLNGKVIPDGEGVIITFHISYKDTMARGSKVSSQFALKSISSHVMEEGMEPYCIDRPDVKIDAILAPLSISARKTASIFLAMFSNKILVEAKEHLKEFWENN